MKIKIVAMLCVILCDAPLAFAANAPAIIPVPQKMALSQGAFKLTPKTRVYTDAASVDTGDYLAARLRVPTGFPVETGVKWRTGAAVKNAILLTTNNAQPDLGAEGYKLTVTGNSVVIRAPGQAGLFYGVQSLLQLLPPEVFASNKVAQIDCQMPCAQIEDKPRFAWRGLLLDVARHFFNVRELKKVMDELAMHKMNILQLHLTDAEGWRVEIKKYPRLTEMGAWRKDIGFNLDPKSSAAYGPDGRYGGFYTQKDIRELVAYAQQRHITIVPEIEMPGHSGSAMACYPELACAGGIDASGHPLTYNRCAFCAGNDECFALVEDVLSEVIELFPGKYIHIGGDEVAKDDWKKCPKCQARIKKEGLKNEEELQSYFIRRVEKFINSRGRTLMGWSEILQGGLAQNAAVMDWIGGGTEAASSGHDIVMSPVSHCYFDFYQSTNHATEPIAAGGFIPLEQVYAFEPIPANLPARFESRVLGAQGNVWTERIASLRKVEYMSFPRACALAEVTWSPKSQRNWNDFTRRLETHKRRLDQFGVNYRPASGKAPDANPF